MNETTFLAEQAARLTYDDLPAVVGATAKLLLLDPLGGQLAFATLPWGKAAMRYTAAKQGAGRSTVAFYGLKANAEDAAFCNGVFGHGFEMDDVEMQTTSHPAVCVIPAVLAVGEQEASSGREVLCALVAGYETFLRFAHAADSMRHRFFHSSSVSGAFGAAAAAGQLLGFDEAVMRDALAIATTQASGNTEYTCSGGTVKRTLGALGAYAGVRSALLAQAGITGSAQALRGGAGHGLAHAALCRAVPHPGRGREALLLLRRPAHGHRRGRGHPRPGRGRGRHRVHHHPPAAPRDG